MSTWKEFITKDYPFSNTARLILNISDEIVSKYRRCKKTVRSIFPNVEMRDAREKSYECLVGYFENRKSARISLDQGIKETPINSTGLAMFTLYLGTENGIRYDDSQSAVLRYVNAVKKVAKRKTINLEDEIAKLAEEIAEKTSSNYDFVLETINEQIKRGRK